MLLFGIATLLLPRRYALFPLLAATCFVAPAQRIVIATLDFNVLRIVVAFGWVRLFLEPRGRSPSTPLDALIVAWAIVGTLVSVAREPTLGVLVYKLGDSFDALGLYFLFRRMLRGPEDLFRLARILALLAAPVAAAFLLEASTGRNAFAIFGGVPEFTWVREGRLRVQGAFPHPIIAGCFWATFLPMFGALALRGGADRYTGLFALAASLLMVVLTASSTPIFTLGAVLLALALFPLRGFVPQIRWAAIATLVALHLTMDKGVWHLLARVDVVGGSTGWHRYFLLDSAIRHFDEWWLLGTPSTAHWGDLMFDVTNEYVLQAVRGGLATLIVFLWMLCEGFREVAQVVRTATDRGHVVMAWALGSALFAHALTFLAISYFGQGVVPWYLHLAAISSLWAAVRRPAPVPAPAPRSPRPRIGAPAGAAAAPLRALGTSARAHSGTPPARSPSSGRATLQSAELQSSATAMPPVSKRTIAAASGSSASSATQAASPLANAPAA